MSRTTPLAYGAVINSKISSSFAVDAATTTGLTFGYRAAKFAGGSGRVNVAAGTVTLTDNATNIVKVNKTSGAVSVGAGDSGSAILYSVVTSSGAITSITDLRAALI